MAKNPKRPKAEAKAKKKTKPAAPAVSAADKAAAQKRINEYVQEPTDGHLALRDRVIQVLRRHQDSGDNSLLTLDDLANDIQPLQPEILRDVFVAEGKAPPTSESKLRRRAGDLVQLAVTSLKEDKLVVGSKEGFKLPALKLPDELPFKISSKLLGWLPRQTEDELTGLERGLLIDGPDDLLHVWKDKNILIDGHTRVHILIRHGRLAELKTLAKSVVEHSFKDLDAVRAWMEERQDARRNQSRLASMYFLGLRYNREKRQGQRSDLQTSAENQRKSTDQRLGKEYGLTPSSVRRAGNLAVNVDAIVEAGERVKEGYGPRLRDLLLRQRRRGGPRITEVVINSIAEEKNQQKQAKLIGNLLKGETIGKKGGGKGKDLWIVRLSRTDAEAQVKELSELGRESLEKLQAAIATYLAKSEADEPMTGDPFG